ncbi:PadR family transcriptional regulator [Parafrankia sp. EUN1f]|uniref:PadR family transcriptional regulator n=1 Tax=Parafrankia sp. EUN1f TaxID=102897 RepID=UPI0001C46371|nr:PadR family transcriptional regulator [Parafrankia sp. EUN1f]EFC81449.1 transcriptional regulator, PadR-like family [Parafrankia sp. EUN1f]
MSLQYAVLGVLEARPLSGYELVQFFDTAAGWVWSAPQSQIYTLLRQMEQRGLIAGTEQVRGTKLKRTVYSLTPLGRKELTSWVSARHPEPPIRDSLLVQALFFDMVGSSAAAAVLEEVVADNEALVEHWREHRDRLLNKDTTLLRERLKHRPETEHDRMAELKAHVFDGLISSATARVEWAKAGIELLKKYR